MTENEFDEPTCEHTNKVAIGEYVAPTCTTAGMTAGEKCADCEEIITAQEEIEALGHDLITVPAQEPTTEAAGWNEYQMCSRCDYTEGYVEIPKLEEPEVPQPELYTVTIADGIKNGTVTVDVTEGEVGTLVTVTATPAAGTKAGKYYDLIGITVNGQFIEGNTFEITAGENVVSAIFGKALITAKSLQLKEQVYVKVNTQFVGFDVDVIENGGLLVWDTPVETPYYDEAAAITGFELASSYDNGFGELDEFVVKTNGISAKEYADELYMCAYIEIADGVYAFSDVQEYSVQIYCQNQLKKATAAEKLKQVCAQMLHYGATAQVQFKHNTTDLANDVAKVPELANYPAGEWNDSLLDTLKTIPTTAFEQNEEIYRTASTLRLKDATIVNVTFRNNEDFDRENGGKAEMLFWYDKNGTLTELVDLSGQDGIDENLFYVVDLTYTGVYAGTGDHEFTADAKGLPAKEYGNTLFACPKFTDAEGNVTYGTVYAYSVETYAQSQINKTSAAETLKAVCKQLVIYGEAAKNYFGN